MKFIFFAFGIYNYSIAAFIYNIENISISNLSAIITSAEGSLRSNVICIRTTTLVDETFINLFYF